MIKTGNINTHEQNVMVIRSYSISGLRYSHVLTPREFLDFSETLLTMQKHYGALHNKNRDFFSEGKYYNRANENKYKIKRKNLTRGDLN